MSSAAPKKRTFRKFQYRGVDLENLLKMADNKLVDLYPARQRRRLNNTGLKPKYQNLRAKLRKARKGLQVGEKPVPVKTHLRNAIIMPDMIGSVVAIFNGKVFNPVEIRAEMIGHYLGEFSLTYKPVRHGRPGIGATSSSKFVPLK